MVSLINERSHPGLRLTLLSDRKRSRGVRDRRDQCQVCA